jgi:hypothetical protein
MNGIIGGIFKIRTGKVGINKPGTQEIRVTTISF